ncbi:hypothetical protein [Actinomadura kijaniata]|nr:hypothetical protein [Actinomadura kijaniata]
MNYMWGLSRALWRALRDGKKEPPPPGEGNGGSGRRPPVRR